MTTEVMKESEVELFEEWWSKEPVAALVSEPTLTAVRFAAWNGWLARSKQAEVVTDANYRSFGLIKVLCTSCLCERYMIGPRN